MYSTPVPSLAEIGQTRKLTCAPLLWIMPPGFITRLFPWCTWRWNTWQSAGWSCPKGCLFIQPFFRAAPPSARRSLQVECCVSGSGQKRDGRGRWRLTWAPAVCKTDSTWRDAAWGGRSESCRCCVPPQTSNSAPADVAVRMKYTGMLVILVGNTQLIYFHWPEWIFVCFIRDPSSTRWATEMPGAADWDESAASSGSAGFLPQEIRNRDGVFPKPGKTGREVHGKNQEYKGSSAVQVRETCLPIIPMLYLLLVQRPV